MAASLKGTAIKPLAVSLASPRGVQPRPSASGHEAAIRAGAQQKEDHVEPDEDGEVHG